MTPNDPKLSDGGGWRDGCAGEGGGAASVTAGAVRCSAWLGVVVIRSVIVARRLVRVVATGALLRRSQRRWCEENACAKNHDANH